MVADRLDFTKLSNAAGKGVKYIDNCAVLDIGSGTFPREIEVRLPGDDGARLTAVNNVLPNLTTSDTVLISIDNTKEVARVETFASGTAGGGVDDFEVSKLVSPDGATDPVVSTDNNGRTNIGGGTVTSITVTGSAATSSLLISNEDISNGRALIAETQSNSVASILSLARSRASAAALQNGDTVFNIRAEAHDGTDYNPGAAIQAVIDGTVSANTVPTQLRFRTTTTNALATRMTIAADGDVRIGDGSPTGKLNVEGSSGDGILLDIGGENDTHILNVDPNVVTSSSPQLLRFVAEVQPTGVITNIFGVNTNLKIGGTSSNNVTGFRLYNANMSFQDSYGGTLANLYHIYINNPSDSSSGSPAITNNYGLYMEDLTLASNNWGLYLTGSGLDHYIQGRLGLNVTGPAAKLDIDQGGSASAIPVIKVEQADVSEEFIRFVGTAASSDITQSIVQEGNQSTTTLTGWLKIYVQDDGNQVGDATYYVPFYVLA